MKKNSESGVTDSHEPPYEVLYLVTDPFFDQYIECLEVLADLGIEFSFKQRIPVFLVYTHLDTLEPSEQIEYAKACLNNLRAMMEEGLEPEHNGTTYK